MQIDTLGRRACITEALLSNRNSSCSCLTGNPASQTTAPSLPTDAGGPAE